MSWDNARGWYPVISGRRLESLGQDMACLSGWGHIFAYPKHAVACQGSLEVGQEQATTIEEVNWE